VVVLPGGERFDIDSNQSVLNAAHAANVLISYSCRSGQCGSCKGRLHSGEVVYPKGQPDALDPDHQAEGYALFCSAFARSDLTIELLQPEFPS
jgi:CDP-4-dehydro-6-deoxyglucose reductase